MPKHHLLKKAGVVAASVKLCRDAAVRRSVGGIVAVEKAKANPADTRLPPAKPCGGARARKANAQPPAALVAHGDDGEHVRRVERIELVLRPLGIDRLTKVALLVEQPDADERHAEIARGLQVVARDISEAARVNRKRFGDRIFEGEERDGTQARRRMLVLEPSRRGQLFLTKLAERLRGLSKGRRVPQLANLLARRRLDDERRIPGRTPQVSVELLPEDVGAMVPHRSQIAREIEEQFVRVHGRATSARSLAECAAQKEATTSHCRTNRQLAC